MSAATAVNPRPNLVLGGNYGESVDPSRWVVIYPPYIDSSRKEREGRKISKEKCVNKPHITEIFDCVQLLGLQTALELDKAYCRDYWQRGRIRVRLFDEQKEPHREEIPNRRALYAKVAALIPQHREQVQASQAKKSSAAKAGSSKDGSSAATKAPSGKGVPAPQKKKKKGKR